ncbi:MAG TPA: sulfur oxidation c-type cytochrome SoxX [Usitatibacter sp.]|jgi:sulfur-oxidizing protein SoxX|nr:sulfur oxidation c-type cytochrome SoxX [Usitatibacter sp.]
MAISGRDVLAGAGTALLAAACSGTPSNPSPATAGDPTRGREVFLARDGGFCVLCHDVPGAALAGDVGPSLAGVGARLTPQQLRERIADMSAVNPDAAMPSFHRTEGLQRVDPRRLGQPVLNDQQLEDVVAYLASLK